MKQRKGRPVATNLEVLNVSPISTLLRKGRAKQKVSQRELANACGCTLAYISNIERGRASALPWTFIKPVSKVLKIDVKLVARANLRSKDTYREYLAFIK